jgi:hypothetical protein
MYTPIFNKTGSMTGLKRETATPRVTVTDVVVTDDGFMTFTGHPDARIKMTDEEDPRLGVISTIISFTGKCQKSANKEWNDIKMQNPLDFPEVQVNLGNLRSL